MPPKKKGQKVDLATFMSETTTGNWADEMDDLPIAPSIKDPNAPKRGDPGYFDSVPDRAARTGGFGASAGGFDSSRPPRDELPLPTRPPYTCFVGNLDFATTEEDLEQFFEGLETVSAKIIKDGMDQKPKGFGYVEFKTLDGLKDALGRSGGQLLGRNVRTSVAEPPKTGGGGFGSSGGFGPSMAEEASQWRRTGPLPAREPPAGGRRYDDAPRGGGFSGGGGGFDASERDWSAARGAKFTPSGPGPSGGGFGGGGGGFGGGFGDRGDRGGFAPRERDAGFAPREDGPSMVDLPDDWRANRPARPTPPPQPERGSGGPGGMGMGMGAPRSGGFQEREYGVAGPAETEAVWQRGSKFQPRQEAPARAPPPHMQNDGPAGLPAELEEKSDWRSTRKPSGPPARQGSADVGSSAEPSPQPARKSLALLPRSAATSTPTSESGDVTSPPATASSKASPFGSARPVDAAKREQEVAAKLAQRDAARKAEQEAKAKAAAERAEKDKAERAAQPKAVHPSRAAAAANDGANQQRPGAVQRNSSNSANGPASSGERRPSHTARSERPAAPAAPTADEDGFVPASSVQTRRAQQAAEHAARDKAEQAKRDEVRPAFSFAAAARAQALVEGEAEGDDVDEVAEKVAEMKA